MEDVFWGFVVFYLFSFLYFVFHIVCLALHLVLLFVVHFVLLLSAD